jgi:hypothetical protein
MSDEINNDELPPPLIKLTSEEIAKAQEEIRKSNIKKERETQLVDKYPTITIAIIGHGGDLIHELLENEDPNIRIFSRAGQPFCLGIATTKMLDFIENLYISDEREETKDTISSYQMLLEVAKYYNSNEGDTQFKGMCDRLLTENPNDSSSKHTKQNIECKKHNQIYMPYYDHRYSFTDNTSVLSGQNGIFVLETLNHTSKSNINYNNNINLALKKYFIKYPDFQTRNIFNQQIITNFLKQFNLEPDLETNLSPDDKEKLEYLRYRYPPEQVALNKKYKDELDAKINSLLLNSKLTRYSKKILEKFPFITIYLIITKFVDESSEIHNLVNAVDDNIIKIKAKELHLQTITNVEDRLRKKELEQQRKEFMKLYTDFDGIIDDIKLSEIINFLKKEGFVVINIIDFSCRYVDKYLDDAYIEDSELEERKLRKEKKLERIRENSEEQLMHNELINKNIGGRKKRRTRRKKSKKVENKKNKKTKKMK